MALEGQKLGLAVSGGLDSTVLLLSVAHWLKRPVDCRLKSCFTVVHVVHKTESPTACASTSMERARRTAAERVKKMASALGFRAIELNARSVSESEADLRAARLTALCEAQTRGEFDAAVFAHHRDDLLETRLIRLLRGVGPDGLKSIEEQTRLKDHLVVIRPLLPFWRGELESYHRWVLEADRDWRVEKESFEPVIDPSNLELKYLRNAVRHRLVPLLDELKQGGKAALARSLDRLVADLGPARAVVNPSGPGLSRQSLLTMERSDRAEVIARYAKTRRLKLSWTRCNEVAKRIETNRKSVSFEIGGASWTLQGDELVIARVESQTP